MKISVLFTLLLLGSCSTYQASKKPEKIEYSDQVVSVGPLEKVTKVVKKLTTTTKKDNELKLSYKQKHYKFWKDYFSKRERARFERHLKNGLQYKDIVKKVFEEHGLPKDLFYVGLIESGYNTHIASHANAVGPWQFIKGTATRYGLRVDRYTDERRSIYKSSQAAANYFKDLYNIFGSWELALCAYNAGEYRIINAIRKGNTRNYVELVKKKLIPKETIFYIPKVAAAKDLVESQFSHLQDHDLTQFYNNGQSLIVRKSFSANKLRRQLKLSKKQFRLLNPEIRNDWVKVRKKHTIYVPKKLHTLASNVVLKMGHRRSKVKETVKKSFNTKIVKKVHKVKRGENLSFIAKKYGVSINSIKKDNKIKKGFIHPGQFLRINQKRKIASTTHRKKIKTPRYHTVRKGEFLGKIARKYNLSLRTLKKLNGLSSDSIYVGKRLLVSSKAKNRFYIVRKGDNLYRIARRFGTSVRQLVRTNSLSQKRIYPNQKILIPLKS